MLGAVACCAVAAVAADVPDSSMRAGALAASVPVDARLFLEVRDAAGLSQTPAGEALGEVLAWLMAQVKSDKQGQFAADRGWRQLFAGALGLQDDRVVELLLSGRIAVAADRWEDLSAAILLAEPTDLALLEEILAPSRVPPRQADRVRRYRLGRNQELVCDDRIVVVGRFKGENDLYPRTLKLLESDRGLCLADLAEFRERANEVPPGARAFLYVGSNLRKGAAAEETAVGWSLLGPRLKATAMSVQISARGLVMETTGRRVAPLTSMPASHEPSVDMMLFLPSSAVAAWTYPVDYVGELRRLRSANPAGAVSFYLRALELGMRPNVVENDLLNHLKGDTAFMIGRIPVRQQGAGGARDEILMPTFALLVGVDDAELVDGTLEEMAANLLRLANLPAGPNSKVAIHSETLSAADEATIIRSIPLVNLLPAGTVRKLLSSVELSWTVADGRLVVGTHRETVRQIVQAFRGETPLMPADAIQQAMRRERSPRRVPEMVFVAQPGAVAEMIDSWLGYIQRSHPEMLEPQWWRQMRRQYGGSQVQLGIRPAAGTATGVVVVSQTIPKFPAHGRLMPGDEIIAIDGRPLAPERPMQSLREGIIARAGDDRLRLTIKRRGREMVVDIPMPVSNSPADQVHPLDLLRQFSKLSRRFAFASYVTWQPSREHVQTRLELRLAPSAIPTPGGSPAADEKASTGGLKPDDFAARGNGVPPPSDPGLSASPPRRLPSQSSSR